MRLLLDTHVVLWWLAGDASLSDEVRRLVDEEPDTFLSPVTLWEVTIKQALGKILEPADLPERILRSGFREVPIRHEHAVTAGRLPAIHRDPFDRMLVAQAQRERLSLVTADTNIQRYDVAVLAV